MAQDPARGVDAPIGHRKGPRPAFGPAETKEAEAMIARGESVAAIAARAANATPGPWHATKTENEPDYESPGLSNGNAKYTVSPHKNIAGWRHDGGYGGYGITKVNAEFIAHAREDIPYLLARLAQAEALLRASQASVQALAPNHSVLLNDIAAYLAGAEGDGK